MIPGLRQRYNAAFREEDYAAFLRTLATDYRWGPDFRVAESPLFLDEPTTRALVAAADDILAQLDTPAFRSHSADAVPTELKVPREAGFPHFLCIDFALCHDAAGRVVPQLIELQGFPTVMCFQAFLARSFKGHFSAIPDDFTSYFGGLEENGYLAALQRTIVADCDPAEVVLLEIAPEQQKTRIDFACTEAMLGVRPVNVSAIKRCRHRLYYTRDGRETPIRRIYNRVIFDELLRRKPAMEFALTDELDVQWAGHPNWYFRISKQTLPFLHGPAIPACRFVSDILADPAGIPGDLNDHVLKPLYSFAGLGVDISPIPEKLAALPNPHEWILQRKITYAPMLATPDIPAKAEVRLILVGDGTGWPRLVNHLVRLTKGAMHGVDFNKGRTWVGATAGFHPPL